MYRYPHLLQYRYDGMPKLEHRSGRSPFWHWDTPNVEGDEHGNVWNGNFGPAKLEEATIFKASRAAEAATRVEALPEGASTTIKQNHQGRKSTGRAAGYAAHAAA